MAASSQRQETVRGNGFPSFTRSVGGFALSGRRSSKAVTQGSLVQTFMVVAGCCVTRVSRQSCLLRRDDGVEPEESVAVQQIRLTRTPACPIVSHLDSDISLPGETHRNHDARISIVGSRFLLGA